MNTSYIIIAILILLLILLSKGIKVDFFYIVLILLFIYSILREKKDYLDTDNIRLKKNNLNPNDSKDDALLKLLYASEYAKNIIVWRQCYIIAFISAFLVWLVLTKRFPTGKNLFLTTLVIFIVTYGVMNYYIVHLHNEVQEKLKEDMIYYNKNYK
jgi:hypothetical protein